MKFVLRAGDGDYLVGAGQGEYVFEAKWSSDISQAAVFTAVFDKETGKLEVEPPVPSEALHRNHGLVPVPIRLSEIQ